MNHYPAPQIIVALDYPDAVSALAMAAQLDPKQCRLKVGKQLFTAAGPQIVDALQQQGFSVFLDLKFHDVPNTVMKACQAAAKLGVWMVNVHALGGEKMLAAAVEGVAHEQGPKPLLLAVTILTSLDDTALAAVNISGGARKNVRQLAVLAQQQGLDGVVCSAQEANDLRQLGNDFCLVTPGIRPADSAADDQVRLMTPQQAISAGSDYLVIGRPITQAKDPLQALTTINEQLSCPRIV